MAGRNLTRATYARLLGEIAIEWNYLERDIAVVAFGYLRGDPDVASHIFAGMGNVSLAHFIGFLCEKFETEESVKGHVLHLIRIFHILRENRNILEHAAPAIGVLGAYHGWVHKPDKKGGLLRPFVARICDLRDILDAIQNARDYAHVISLVIARHELDDTERVNAGPTEREAAVRALASLGKPLLPRKLNPAQTQANRRAAALPPQPSRK